MKRDNQRNRVYTWESIFLRPPASTPNLTLIQCQELVDTVWYDYIRNKSARGNPPKVKIGRGFRSWAWADVISISPHNLFPAMVLHEVTHSLQFEMFARNIHNQAWHGPQFVRLLIDLLVEYTTDADEEFLVSTAIERKIDVAGKDEVPRPRRKERSS